MLISTLSCITKHLLNHPTFLTKLVFLIKVSSPLWSLMFLTLWTPFLLEKEQTKMRARIMQMCSHLVTANVACTISQSWSKTCFDYWLHLVDSFVLNHTLLTWESWQSIYFGGGSSQLSLSSWQLNPSVWPQFVPFDPEVLISPFPRMN